MIKCLIPLMVMAMVIELPRPFAVGQIFTIPPDFQHRNFYDYEAGDGGRYYTDKQCEVLEVIHDIDPLYDCKYQCNMISHKCTAINQKNPGECRLLDCGSPQPFPIGQSFEGVDGWYGKSVQRAPYAFTRYHGPYGLYFNEKQCTLIETLKGKGRVQCENLCDESNECTAFNYNIETRACELRGCSDPQPMPAGSHQNWEGWSKNPISKDDMGRPWPKCPSLNCRSFDFPSKLKEMSFKDHKNYCDCTQHSVIPTTFCKSNPSCSCHSDPYCHWRCGKCQ